MSFVFGKAKSQRAERFHHQRMKAELKVLLNRVEPMLSPHGEELRHLRSFMTEFLEEPEHGWDWPLKAYEVERSSEQKERKFEAL